MPADCLQIHQRLRKRSLCKPSFYHGCSFDLSPEKGALIITLSEVGVSQRTIATDLSCNQAAVRDVIRHFREAGSKKDRFRFGRPPCSTPTQDRFIALTVCRNHFRTAPFLKGQWQHPLGPTVLTSNARTAQARCPISLERNYSPCPAYSLSPNAPACQSITS